jgi:hypothetical protein
MSVPIIIDKHSLAERPLEVGVFQTVDAARNAVHGLLAAGFTKDQITVLCSDETKEQYFHEFEHQDPAGTHTPLAAATGGTIGAVVGALTVVASAAATGSVALLAAGPISTLAGGVAGGLVGAMMTRGVEKELANFYQQAVVEGRILVAAEDTGPDSAHSLAKAAQILAEAGAEPLPMREG